MTFETSPVGPPRGEGRPRRPWIRFSQRLSICSPESSAESKRDILVSRCAARRLLLYSPSSGRGLKREIDGRGNDSMIRLRLSRFFGVLLGVLAHAAAVGAQAGTGSWVSVGPAHVGAILFLVVSPSAPSALYA